MVITILEDNALIMEEVKRMVCELRPEATVYTYGKIGELSPANLFATDIIISDICLGDGDAIETLGALQQKNDKLKIIYMTGFVQNATRIFKSNPSHFLVKPFEASALLEAIEKCENEIASENDDMLFLPCNGGNICIRKKRIKYIESNGRKLKIYKTDGVTECYGRLDELEDQLGETFLRCHKSYIVNMVYIKTFIGAKIELVTGEELSVSRSCAAGARDAHTVFLGGLLK
ncbi:MAG: response regulator transcription factor [Clostridia bacterium]|nr:response regulator transcription factor [Clostridia bacterium]